MIRSPVSSENRWIYFFCSCSRNWRISSRSCRISSSIRCSAFASGPAWPSPGAAWLSANSLASATNGDRDLLRLIVPHHFEVGFCLRLHLVDECHHFGRIIDLLSVDLRHEVSGLQASAGRRTSRIDLGDTRASLAKCILPGVRCVRTAALGDGTAPQRARTAARCALSVLAAVWGTWLCCGRVLTVGSHFVLSVQQNAHPAAVSFRVARNKMKQELAAITFDHQRNRASRLSGQIGLRVAAVGKRATVDRNHSVVRLQSGLRRGAIWIHAGDFEPVARVGLLLELDSKAHLLRSTVWVTHRLAHAVLLTRLLRCLRFLLDCGGWIRRILSRRLVLRDEVTPRPSRTSQGAKDEPGSKVTEMLHVSFSISNKIAISGIATVS